MNIDSYQTYSKQKCQDSHLHNTVIHLAVSPDENWSMLEGHDLALPRAWHTVHVPSKNKLGLLLFSTYSGFRSSRICFFLSASVMSKFTVMCLETQG